MLQVIITATLFITGIFAPEERVLQATSSTGEVCLETNWEPKKTNFTGKQNTHLLQENKNLKNEYESETI